MSIIDEITKHLSLDEVLKYVPELKKNGSNYVGNCPSGHDSTSGTCFHLNTEAPNFNCFNCGLSGSYIHLVELVKFGKVSKGQKDSETFKETLKYLMDKYDIESGGNSGYKEMSNVTSIIENVIKDYNNQLIKYAKNLIPGIEKKYGLSEDFIMSELWGYGHECPSIRLSEFYSIDELLSTGLFNKSERTKTGLFHIYQNRIVMPYEKLGRIVYSIGRSTKKTKPFPGGKEAPKYFKQYINKKGREFISKSVQNQILLSNSDFLDIIVTEGITDYLVAKMHGINSVSAVTTTFKKEEYEKVIELCGKFKKVYIVNDNDSNGAGKNGSDRICKMLIDAGINPYPILIPRHTNIDKIDFAEYVRDNGIEAFNKLKDNTRPYIDQLIEEIPEDIDKTELIEALDDVIDVLKRVTPDVAEIYVMDKIKNRFKLSSMKAMLKTILDKCIPEQAFETVNNEAANSQSMMSIFNENSIDMNMISSGQDFKEGKMYYTITRPHQVTDKNGVMKITNKPFLVTSDREIIEIKDGQIINDNLVLSKKIPPEAQFEYWTFKGSEYSVEKFIKNEVQLDPASLFKSLKERFSKHLYFTKDYHAPFVSVWAMTTALYMVFPAIGYVHLWAEKRSGKTTLLEIMNAVGFNSMMSSSMSDAAVYRLVELTRCALLIDEAENLNPSAKAKENNPSEKLELLKSGYKKSGKATRCEGQSNTVISFSNYCMKVMSGTKSLESILADRTIILEMKRILDGIEVEEFIESRLKTELESLRDQICCFGMMFSNKINDIFLNKMDSYRDTLAKHKVMFRAKEMWTPYLCVALLIDEFDPSLNVFESLLKMANDDVETKETFGGDSKSAEILEHLYIWTKRVSDLSIKGMIGLRDGDIYFRKGITDNFIKDVLKSEEHEDDFNYVNYQNLKQMLRRFNVIDKDSDIKNHRLGGIRGAALILNKDRMLKSLMTYKNSFGSEVLEDIQKEKGIAEQVEEELKEMELD